MSDFVFEFVIHCISCKNTKVQSSPIVITIPGCPNIIIDAKSASLCKIKYERGKRIRFNHTSSLNLNMKLTLVHGHGNLSARAECFLDFLEIIGAIDQKNFTTYTAEIGLKKPSGSYFGVMECSFQLMRLSDFQQIMEPTTPRSLNVTKKSIPQGLIPNSPRRSKVIVKRDSKIEQQQQQQTIGNNSVFIPELKIPPTRAKSSVSSSRSSLNGSIHERYMKKNERWYKSRADTDCRRSFSSSRNKLSKSMF